MLAVVAFSMSMIGTFLGRSGILTSVHAFASIRCAAASSSSCSLLYIGGALLLFGLRVRTVKEGRPSTWSAARPSLVLNNLLLSVILGLVFIGTLYPLVTQALGEEISVGPPYFNAVAGPIALVLVAFMALGPMLRWRRDQGREIAGRVALPILVSAASLLALVIFAPGSACCPGSAWSSRPALPPPASRLCGSETSSARRCSSGAW
jgi:cytochrome c-type biogenesis protein CcmF